MRSYEIFHVIAFLLGMLVEGSNNHLKSQETSGKTCTIELLNRDFIEYYGVIELGSNRASFKVVFDTAMDVNFMNEK